MVYGAPRPEYPCRRVGETGGGPGFKPLGGCRAMLLSTLPDPARVIGPRAKRSRLADRKRHEGARLRRAPTSG